MYFITLNKNLSLNQLFSIIFFSLIVFLYIYYIDYNLINDLILLFIIILIGILFLFRQLLNFEFRHSELKIEFNDLKKNIDSFIQNYEIIKIVTKSEVIEYYFKSDLTFTSYSILKISKKNNEYIFSLNTYTGIDTATFYTFFKDKKNLNEIIKNININLENFRIKN
jgi:hypothetical protein